MQAKFESTGNCHQVWQKLNLPTHSMNLSTESRFLAAKVLNRMLAIALDLKLEAMRGPGNLTNNTFYQSLAMIIELNVQLEQVQCLIHQMEPSGLCEILGEVATELGASFDLVIENIMADLIDEAALEMAEKLVNDDEQNVENLPSYGTGDQREKMG